VLAVNRSPIAKPDNYITQASQAMTITPLANDEDPDGDVLQLTGWSALPQFGSISSLQDAAGSFVYTPYENATGLDLFNYTASDGSVPVIGSVNIMIGKFCDIVFQKLDSRL
jgi:hypothetical protein